MLLVLCVLLFGCGGCLSAERGVFPPPAEGRQHDVYVYSNHWHTGVILQQSALLREHQNLVERFAEYPWVEIGWGDDGFYRAPTATVCLALQAAFVSRGGVLHVVGVGPDPVEFYRSLEVSLYRIRVGEEGLRRMEEYIFDTFETRPRWASTPTLPRDQEEESIELQDGLYRFSRFYAARGGYWLLHTCNNWTAEAIRKSGFPITPFYAVTADNLTWQLTHGEGGDWAETVLEWK